LVEYEKVVLLAVRWAVWWIVQRDVLLVVAMVERKVIAAAATMAEILAVREAFEFVLKWMVVNVETLLPLQQMDR